ncbi:hypothetical protein BBK82_35290 [Lentzea guizhouensis]|uniref:Uncharacterized protein n=1 Tax=Lentzea guizhouensis TaxID=1586287 RepID=A0A1B2HRZ7_9PSEU|nr:hypothetical protein [Lentzea guizhouensis]ANZ40499.1 hypothetical protein BBK82_35290 [Lentzea guizhouensis]
MATATPALVARDRRLRLVRLVEVLAAVGAVTTVVAGGYLVEEVGPGASLAAASGLALLVTASFTARRVRRKVRYRVDRPNSTAWLAGKIAAVLVGGAVAVSLAWALGVPPLPRSLVVFALVGAVLGVMNTHAARWTLLQIDATGVEVGQAHVPWPSVARLELAGAAPGQVEIGVQPVPDGTVPVRTTVPAVAARRERVRWAVDTFGSPAIPIVVREPDPLDTVPPAVLPPPAGTKPTGRVRRWPAGVVVLAVVLVGGAVTLTGTADIAGRPVAAPPPPEVRYSATAIDNPCAVVDVQVLRNWSTAPEIISLPRRKTLPDHEWGHCGARGNESTGRVANLNLVVAVAESADAARAFYDAQKARDLLGTDGEAPRRGPLDGLGDSAEFEQGSRTHAGRTAHVYSLGLRDDNLCLFLKLRSEAGSAEWDGVDVPALGDTTRAEALAALQRLR